MDDVLSLMKVLPSYEHQKILFHSVKARLTEVLSTPQQIAQLSEYLSDKKYKEVCSLLKNRPTALKEEPKYAELAEETEPPRAPHEGSFTLVIPAIRSLFSLKNFVWPNTVHWTQLFAPHIFVWQCIFLSN